MTAKDDRKREYKMETARVSQVRLAAKQSNHRSSQLPKLENAREIILRLIEAIKQL